MTSTNLPASEVDLGPQHHHHEVLLLAVLDLLPDGLRHLVTLPVLHAVHDDHAVRRGQEVAGDGGVLVVVLQPSRVVEPDLLLRPPVRLYVGHVNILHGGGEWL